MKDRVQLEAVYPQPPERVWQALTDPEVLSQWLMPTDFKPMIGYRFRLDRPGQSAVRGKVLEVEPGKLLSFTWEDDEEEGQPSLVVWSLDPHDGGTKLTVEHRPLEQPAVTCIAVDLYFNWRQALKRGLPFALRLLAARMTRPPIVYVDESVEKELVAK
jgi:uncharacterized protein YndB with AHSA1/START domain